MLDVAVSIAHADSLRSHRKGAFVSEHLVGDASDLNDDSRLLVCVAGREIIVFRHHGAVYALDNRCVHMGGPAGEGVLVNRVEPNLAEDGNYLGEHFSEKITHIVCPWHGWEYDIDTGRCAALPRLGLKRYDVEIRGGKIYVQC
jgi:nitrite reductase/ring-hydroxylating ferredoxin subunit